MRDRIKKENIKVEKKDNSTYYIANQDLKKLDFIDNTISFIGDIRNCPAVFSIKYNSGGYGNTVYTVSNNYNDEFIKLDSLIKVKNFIANNIVS